MPPLGDCTAVQSSPYARLFGVLPVGVLGLIGYAVFLGAWLLNRIGRGRPPVSRPRPIIWGFNHPVDFYIDVDEHQTISCTIYKQKQSRLD